MKDHFSENWKPLFIQAININTGTARKWLYGVVQFSVPVTNTMTKKSSLGEKEVFVSSYNFSPFLEAEAGSKCGNLKAELKKGHEKCCLLAYSSWIASLACFYNPGPSSKA